MAAILSAAYGVHGVYQQLAMSIRLDRTVLLLAR